MITKSILNIHNIIMVFANEYSRKIVFAVRRRQKSGSDGSVQSRMRVGHDC